MKPNNLRKVRPFLEKIIVFDFGSQTCHLIARRLHDLGVEAEIWDPETDIRLIKKASPAGLILSGGPASIYEPNAPTIDPKILDLDLPVLGICYGWQLIAQILGGQVKAGQREYGPKKLNLSTASDQSGLKFIEKVPPKSVVWLSHGDTVVKLPAGFRAVGSTDMVRNALVVNDQKQIFGVQFHPEVKHTQSGRRLLQNFIKLCGLKTKRVSWDIPKMVTTIRDTVGDKKVLAAVSGGVDSTVAAVLVGQAIGSKLVPVYVDSGLMRQGTTEEVQKIFKKLVGIEPIILDRKPLFLQKLKGVVDPEKKRQVIGNLYIELFEQAAKKIKGIGFLCQGTIYSDVIESKGTKKASRIKSHHNVGGLPEKMKLTLLEPLRHFYKDEVRQIGRKLGLEEALVNKQPFPGPGQAIRIMGEITSERLDRQQQADQIVLQELAKADWLTKVFQSFPIMTGVNSTAVKGDARFYGEVVGLRVYSSDDVMTAGWCRLPYDLLQQISTRIVNEVPGVSRVVYDITTKPPATMEWE
jgi:GMP synthase (glutamine-hydrolysing)